LREQSAIKLDQCGLEAALAETGRRISKL